MYIGYNPNPSGNRVGDCSVRAICKAVGLIWEDAYLGLVTEGYKLHDMPSANYVWGRFLRKNGFNKYMIANRCPDCITVEQFTKENPKGTFVLATDQHVVTVVDGDYYDSWDSGDEVVNYYWKKEV